MLKKTWAFFLVFATTVSASTISLFDEDFTNKLAVVTEAVKICPAGYKLVWQDEFNSLNSLKQWNYELYNGEQYNIPGWGNNEFEWYTAKKDNANVATGRLVITARTTTPTQRKGCCNGTCTVGQCEFASARIRTHGKFAIAPTMKTGNKTVRIAVRAKLPVGKGMWPGIWMLPETTTTNCSGCGAYGPWPASGAITLVQGVNSMADISGGIAFGGASPNSAFNSYNVPFKRVSEYHDFVFEWTLDSMKWFVDGKIVHTASRNGSAVPGGGGGWFSNGPGAGPDSPFDKPFYLVVNLAVGGNPTGATKMQIKETLKIPKSLLVDYIRVCRK